MKRQPLRIASSYLCIVLVGLSLAALSAISWIAPVAFAKSMGEMAPGQSLGIPSVPNLRDLGGYKTESGAIVAKGLVYRSNQKRY